MPTNDVTAASPGSTWIGQTVGSFVLNRCIGVGRTACVFEAEDTRLGRHVAIKVLASRARDVAPLLHEARLIAAMDHPHIVGVHEFGEVGELQFIAMELLPTHVASLLSERHHLSVSMACSIARGAALGLAHAHQKGIVHRDVKPSNLLLTAEMECKVSDFGLAFRGDDEPGRLGFVGTPYYVAPEVIRGGRGEPASDIYSLGATLWHMLIGEPPFHNASPRAILNLHVRGRLPSLQSLRGDVPTALAHIVHQSLAKSPADRFVGARELADALSQFASPTTVDVGRGPSNRNAPRSRKRNIVWGVVAGAIAAAVIAGGVGVVVYSGQSAERGLAAEQPLIEIRAADATQLMKVGNEGERTVRVVGRVSAVERSETGKSIRILFVSGENGFHAVCYSEMFDDLRNRFGERFDQDLIGRDLQVQGTLRIYKDRPRIIIRKLDQLRLWEDAS